MPNLDLTCLGCGGIIPCPDIPDTQVYSLQNQPLGFVIDCPSGYNCIQGNSISFVCCGQIISAPIPAGATLAQITAILNALGSQCLNLQSTCGELGVPPGGPVGGGGSPPLHLFYNSPQTCSVLCPDGTPFSYTITAGQVVGATLAKANSAAQALACQRAKQKRICLSDLPKTATCGQSFSASVSVSGVVITPCTWTIVSGALPDGLTLGGNSPTIDTTLGAVETIQGTPSVNGTFNFTLRCDSANGSFIQRAYSIQVSGTCLVSALSMDATSYAAFSALLCPGPIPCVEGPWTDCYSIAQGTPYSPPPNTPLWQNTGNSGGIIDGRGLAFPGQFYYVAIPFSTGFGYWFRIPNVNTPTGTYVFHGGSGGPVVSSFQIQSGMCAPCPTAVLIQNFSSVFANPCPLVLKQQLEADTWSGEINRIGSDCTPNPTYSFSTVGLNFPSSIGVFTLAQVANFGAFWTLVIYGVDTGNNPTIVWQGALFGTGPRGVYGQTGGCLSLATVTLV